MGVNYGAGTLRVFYKGTDKVVVADIAVDATGGTGGAVPVAGLVYQQQNGHFYAGGRLGVGETAPGQQLVVKGVATVDGTAPVTIEINDGQTGAASWTGPATYGAIDFRSADAAAAGAGVKVRIGAFMTAGHGGYAGIRLSCTTTTLLDRAVLIGTYGRLMPDGDNLSNQSLGDPSARWTVVYAASSTISTSDEREKLWRGAMTANELAAARAVLAGELGFYQWHYAIAEKGAEGARLHFGVRAQRVWDIFETHGLDPARYAFLCYDQWLDAEGVERDRYGLRTDQLALFLIAAQEQRLALLEAASA